MFAFATALLSPILVFVHGGAWISGEISQYRSLESAWRDQGYCVILVEYGLAPAVKHPAQVSQLNEAISKISNGKDKNCDPNRLYLVGHSAGAHMIAFWDSEFKNSRVHGLVGLEGIYDLPLLVKSFPAYEAQFVSLEFGSDRAAASPSTLTMKNKVPWLLLHSTEDELVDQVQTEKFRDHLRAQKITVEMTRIKGTHFGTVESLKNKKSAAAKALHAFVMRP